jgi:hypothetical protein
MVVVVIIRKLIKFSENFNKRKKNTIYLPGYHSHHRRRRLPPFRRIRRDSRGPWRALVVIIDAVAVGGVMVVVVDATSTCDVCS